MKVTCCKCGKSYLVSPNRLKHGNITEDNYRCWNCFLKRKRNGYKKPNWNYYRALKKLEQKAIK